MAVVLVVVGGVGTLVLSPINGRLDDHKAQIEKINQLMTPLLTLYAQHASDMQVIKTMQDDINRKLDTSLFLQDKEGIQRQLVELIGQVHKLEGDIVSRSDNMTHWEGTAAQISDLKRQLEALQLRVENLSEGRGKTDAPTK